MKEVDKGVDKMITKKSENSTLKDVETVCENGKKKGKSDRLPTKVVVRRLPPTMTKETFLQQCSPLPPVDYLYFVQADMSLAPQCFSRAYLNFVNHQDIFTFTQKFDNYVFVDVKGQEYPAVVEFAPFQRIPKRRPTRKKDPKMGTIESSPIFISFKEKLEAELQENKTSGNSIKQHFFETSTNSEDKKEVTSTPLLDFIKNRKAERQRIRDEKREEKRKRDLERRRAKDEMRKLKKDDESPVVKHNSVLLGIENVESKATVKSEKIVTQHTINDETKSKETENSNRKLSNKNLPNTDTYKTDTVECHDPNMPKMAVIDSVYQAILDGGNNSQTAKDKEKRMSKIKENLFSTLSKHPLKNISDSCNGSIKGNTETFNSDIVKLRNELNALLKELNTTNNSICASIVSRRHSIVIKRSNNYYNGTNNNNNNSNNSNHKTSIKNDQSQKSRQTAQDIADQRFEAKTEKCKTNIEQATLTKTVCPLINATFGKQNQLTKNTDDNKLLGNNNRPKEMYEIGKVKILKPVNRNQNMNEFKKISKSENCKNQSKCLPHVVNNVTDNIKCFSSASSESTGSESSPSQKVSIPDKIFSPQQISSYNTKLRNLHSSGLIKTSSLIKNCITTNKCESVQNGLSVDNKNSSTALNKSAAEDVNDKKPVLNSYNNKPVLNKTDNVNCIQVVENENISWKNNCMTIPRRPHTRKMYVSNSFKYVSNFQNSSKVPSS